MSKSVYSLVLMDDVIEAIDEMAYSMNTSRSNLINQILAEKVSFITPEKRMKDIFSYIENLMDKEFKMQFMPSDTILSIKSPLKYKYKPTINYNVELYKNNEKVIGKLKVSFRTQSDTFIQMLNNFFKIWVMLEEKYLSSILEEQISYEILDGKLVREFLLPVKSKLKTTQDIGNAIGNYIKVLDEIIKIYFKYIETPSIAIEKMETLYMEYLNKGAIII